MNGRVPRRGNRSGRIKKRNAVGKRARKSVSDLNIFNRAASIYISDGVIVNDSLLIHGYKIRHIGDSLNV